jgi:hypothetical protein
MRIVRTYRGGGNRMELFAQLTADNNVPQATARCRLQVMERT